MLSKLYTPTGKLDTQRIATRAIYCIIMFLYLSKKIAIPNQK